MAKKRTVRPRTTEPDAKNKNEAWGDLEMILKEKRVFSDDVKQAYEVLRHQGAAEGAVMTIGQIEAVTKLLEGAVIEKHVTLTSRIQESINNLIDRGSF